jgi:hypothetical protein
MLFAAGIGLLIAERSPGCAWGLVVISFALGAMSISSNATPYNPSQKSRCRPRSAAELARRQPT